MTTSLPAGFDLNLLRALDALLTDSSVSSAARRVGVTQSAMSRSLRRLRELLGDELLVRTSRGMHPTARALALQPQVSDLLRRIAALVSTPAFEPAASERTFRILTAELGYVLVVASLLERIRREAPLMNLDLVPVDRGIAAVEAGSLDMYVGPRTGSSVGLVYQPLYEDDFACLVAEANPVRRLTLSRFTTMPHVLVAPTGRPGSPVDSALQAIGKQRRVAFRTPSFLSVPSALEGSPYITTLPRRLAEFFRDRHRLRILELPLKVDPISVCAVWHEVYRSDPAHAWFRQLVLALGKQGPPSHGT